MMDKIVKTEGKKTLVQISTWLKVTPKEITHRHKLYCHAVDKNLETQTGFIWSFKYHGFEMCLEEFASRRSPVSCIGDSYPDFIAGNRVEIFPYAQSLLIELDEHQERVRLYMIPTNYTPEPEPAPLRVCERCLMAIESREGSQITRKIYVDEDNPQKCDWCEESDFDILYEIL
jgi:hypothetical protein